MALFGFVCIRNGDGAMGSDAYAALLWTGPNSTTQKL
jgi:hypothetical protein